VARRALYALAGVAAAAWALLVVAVISQGPPVVTAQSFVQQRPARADSNETYISAAGTTVVSAPSTGQLKLRGWSIGDPTGAVCEIRIYDGTTSVGTTMIGAAEVASGGQSVFHIPGGVYATGGIFVTADSTVDMVIYYDQ